MFKIEENYFLKAMGASIHDAHRHADCMWNLWLGAKNKIQFAEGSLPEQIISDGEPVMLANFTERLEIDEKFSISRGRCLTYFAHLYHETWQIKCNG